MLDNTLVCNLAEFGRTPRVNRPAAAITGRNAGPATLPAAASREAG